MAEGQEKARTVAILIPAPMRQRILSADAERRLASFADVVATSGAGLTAGEAARLLSGAVACLTGWGTPPLTEEILAGNPQLRLVAHTAGSVRHLVPQSSMERGLRVSHAAAIIADAVAEFVIAQSLVCLRWLHTLDRAMKDGQEWEAARAPFPGRLLRERVIGVVGSGHVGQAVIRLFKAFGCRVLVSDPYLTPERAVMLGVEPSGLADLFAAADIVTLHVPVLPETRRMIGQAQLRLLRDGTIFINTARAAVIDEDALLSELKTGRIVAALDVFDQEPLPPDSPFRSLANVVLSPHVAGLTLDTYLLQGQAMVDELERFFTGEPLRYEIPATMIPIMA